jgi:hypothetical protein
MTQESYQDKLRRHSSESRYDPLRDAVRQVLSAWDADDDQEKNDLSESLWQAMGQLEAVFRGTRRGGEEDVPEVEVTYDRSPLPVEVPETPPEGRRSGAKNLSAPEYQNAFISEARASMGMPSVQEAEALLGRSVTLVFNVDLPPVRGTLTTVTTSGNTAYLVLDDDQHLMYPLNSIQEIRA